MDNIDPIQQISEASPPCFSDDSIFFNLILGTNYENTKENCLQFLKNYSKTIFFPKREVFKILINELTLNENSIKILGNNESIYLMRQLIKKYSRNIILNALYDFVNEKENEFFSPGFDNNNINSTDESSIMSKLINNETEKDSKFGFNNSNIIREKEKEEDDEKSQLPNEEDDDNKKENNQFLSKKRKLCKKRKKLKLKWNNKKKKNKNISKKEIKEKYEEKKENIEREKGEQFNDKKENEEKKIDNLLMKNEENK